MHFADGCRTMDDWIIDLKNNYLWMELTKLVFFVIVERLFMVERAISIEKYPISMVFLKLRLWLANRIHTFIVNTSEQPGHVGENKFKV